MPRESELLVLIHCFPLSAQGQTGRLDDAIRSEDPQNPRARTILAKTTPSNLALGPLAAIPQIRE